ncbi:MAG: NADH-quinone oxidoreductase subunit L [Candidatus Omnitrophota bacterium]|jgi:NADH-quinone oxidoreductase subunit L
MLDLLWIILLLPLSTFLLLFLCPKPMHAMTPHLACLASLISLITTIFVFQDYLADGPRLFECVWLSLTHIQPTQFLPGIQAPIFKDIQVGFLIDGLNMMMLLIINTIAFCVHVFSVYYMDSDESKRRYFAFLNLFTFSMIGIITASSLLQIFMFWELVGLASYLLIGFWYQKSAASNAARKAFVVNRFADLGFLIGMILLYLVYGSLNIRDLTAIGFIDQAVPLSVLSCIGILIALGTFGKSAQWPFSSWLPDAMEGPTPVSALIHSATMVAAGVYLIARVFELFAASPLTLNVILWIGCFTSLTAALSACTQIDIKKILAYSTISQLGLMMMGLGAGHQNIAIFHLLTHACFKSMLFLIAGALIHRCDTNDIYLISRHGVKRDVQLVFLLLVGVASLCGIPPFSGFFSKDAILHSVFQSSFSAGVVGLLITSLTAFYAFRMVFILLRQDRCDLHPHADKSISMTMLWSIPLWILGILSILVGFSGSPLTHEWIINFLDATHHSAQFDMTLFAWTLAVIISGIGLSFALYRKPNMNDDPLPNHTFVKSNFAFDHMYGNFVSKAVLPLSKLTYKFETAVPIGIMVDKLCWSILAIGRILSRLQNGLLQNYILISMIALIVAMYYLIHGGMH